MDFHYILELLKETFVFLAVVLIVIVLMTHVRLEMVAGNSMYPTYKDGDYIIVTDWVEPKDNDAIILDTSYIEGYEEDGEHIIKRYYASKSTDGYYVLGDNSEVSYDSRYYGEAPKSALEGVVLVDLSDLLRSLISKF
jgi:signal peptidase I